MEHTEDIVELYAGPEAGINYSLHDLPERLQEAYPLGVCVTLGDQDQDGPPQFLWYLTIDPHVLDDLYELHPPPRFGGGGVYLSQIDRMETRLEVLRAEVGVPACLVGA